MDATHDIEPEPTPADRSAEVTDEHVRTATALVIGYGMVDQAAVATLVRNIRMMGDSYVLAKAARMGADVDGTLDAELVALAIEQTFTRR